MRVIHSHYYECDESLRGNHGLNNIQHLESVKPLRYANKNQAPKPGDSSEAMARHALSTSFCCNERNDILNQAAFQQILD